MELILARAFLKEAELVNTSTKKGAAIKDDSVMIDQLPGLIEKTVLPSTHAKYYKPKERKKKGTQIYLRITQSQFRIRINCFADEENGEPKEKKDKKAKKEKKEKEKKEKKEKKQPKKQKKDEKDSPASSEPPKLNPPTTSAPIPLPNPTTSTTAPPPPLPPQATFATLEIDPGATFGFWR